MVMGGHPGPCPRQASLSCGLLQCVGASVFAACRLLVYVHAPFGCSESVRLAAGWTLAGPFLSSLKLEFKDTALGQVSAWVTCWGVDLPAGPLVDSS